jgi:hypothetical protein
MSHAGTGGGGPAELEDLYDEVTLALLDGGGPKPPRPAMRGVGGAPAVAVATALGLGMREALSPERPRGEIVEEVDLAATEPDGGEPVRVVFVPHAPRATRAYVRPWLFQVR